MSRHARYTAPKFCAHSEELNESVDISLCQTFFCLFRKARGGIEKRFLVLVLCAVFFCPVLVQAVVVSLEDSGWALVMGPISGEVSVIVDNVTGDSVYIELFETFDSPPESGLLAPIIVEFQKISPAATTIIVISNEYIVNDTGREWFGFDMSLFDDLLDPQACFGQAFIPDGGQLEEVYYSWNYGYQGLPARLTFVDTDGNGVLSSPPGDDIFWPGYMGGQIVIATNPDMQVGSRFGLKEIPSVPEPTTLLLFGTGLLPALRCRRWFV